MSINFAKLPVGSVCVVDVQFNRRVQTENGRAVPLLQYVVSLAITVAIKDTCEINGLLGLELRIKWPNDLYLHVESWRDIMHRSMQVKEVQCHCCNQQLA
ncbi:hypothetical protein Nepgr_033190 [Nepenthes gracilis]|uniref:BPL/LPL catalytic domain-containing protein n=1 Tax=Nepenthes gracilis TaxID=150966 RepID=A0AAD3Y6E2_NEPGR|nr:hypothetical protein Nepgr_033190 [Nepenthes gracilis]